MGKIVKSAFYNTTIDGIVKEYNNCKKQYGYSSKKLKLELLYDSITPLLYMYAKELKARSQKDLCTPLFTAALVTIAMR